MKHSYTVRQRKTHGFSLVEMLIVIAVIGIVVGVGVATISSITQRYVDVAAKRQAQFVAAIAAQAMHAGDTTLLNAGTKAEALVLLSAGVYGESDFAEVSFRVNLSIEQQELLMPYLAYNNGLLMIEPNVE
jgi:prepilin-type N-terminal cleavage/methylation domain-containing protein